MPQEPRSSNPLLRFADLAGARWFWPLLALVLMAEGVLGGLALAGLARGQAVAVGLLVVGAWGATLALALLLARLALQHQADAQEGQATYLQWRETLSQAQAQAQAADLRLREALDAMPAGFAIYDEHNTLVARNKVSARMFPHLEGEGLIGKTYEQLLRRALDQGNIYDAVGQEAQWLSHRLAEWGTLTAPVLRSTVDGRWMHHYETRTPSGDTVLVRLDVTDLVEKGLALERANGLLARLSVTDGLTGVANRRQFDQSLQAEWQRSQRSELPVSLLMIDIDHFKRYNDHYGHVAGDECLRRVARLLETCAMRSGELAARYGGEEFALLLPGSDAAQARVAAQHCMDELFAAAIPHANSPVSSQLTFSIGVATLVAGLNMPASTLVQRADEALYSAKRTSRARFTVAAT